MCAMAIVPLNVHTGTGGDVYFDGLGIHYGHKTSIYRQDWSNQMAGISTIIYVQ
jgi:hypothetical protein